MSDSPWKEIYDSMNNELPENDAERHVLEMLRSGQDISDCLEYWGQMGMDKESFFKFMDRIDRRETEEVRGNNRNRMS